MNPAQKNRVRAALLALNKAARAAEDALARDGDDEVLYRWRNTLSPERRAEALRAAADIRSGLARAALSLGLEAEDEDPLLALSSRLSALWVELEDAKAKALRAYGPVSDGLERRLDPELDELERLADRLRRALARRHAV